MELNIFTLLDDAPALIAILRGPQHVFEYANKLYLQSLNQKDNSIIGKPVCEAFPELASQGICQILDAVFENRQEFKADEIQIFLDVDDTGIQEFFFSTIYSPIVGKDKNVEGIFVHATDVTGLVKDRKNAEKSRAFLEQLIADAPVATGLYKGRDLVIELANDTMIKFWGKTGEVVGKKLEDVLPELFGQPFFDLLQNVFDTGKPYRTHEQKCLLNINGTLSAFYFNFSYEPIFDAGKKVVSILNMAIDVTQSVNAKEKLKYTEARLRTAIDMANLGTWEWDLATDTVKINDKINEWRGLKSLKTLPMAELMMQVEEREEIYATLNDAVKFPDTGMVTMEYSVKNDTTGEVKRIHSRGKIFFDDNNKPAVVTGISQDVTLQRITEAELAEKVLLKTAELNLLNDDLKLLNSNLEQFVYVASHDLQEPLRKINIFSDMLLKNSGSNLNEDGKIYAQKISKAASRMSLLINDLLDFSRISSRDKIFVPVDLNKILREIAIDYELLIKQKCATITVDTLPVIEAVPLQMNQLFYNLVGNALKFSKKDIAPVVKISCAALTNDDVIANRLNPEIRYCCISVTDNGIGFDPRYTQRIFEIFQRLHGRYEYAGTGIGLALAKKIADNHNGNISAVSTENNGATFQVILPVKR